MVFKRTFGGSTVDTGALSEKKLDNTVVTTETGDHETSVLMSVGRLYVCPLFD